MLSRLLGSLSAGLIESFFVENAKNMIKPRVLIASYYQMRWFEFDFIPKYNIRTIKYVSDERALVAHFFQTNHREEKPASINKKAIIYVLGNCHYVAEALPRIKSFVTDFTKLIKKLEPNTHITCFCQDYRGRGFNQSSEEENFNDYTLLQDAKDQAALIHHLVDKEGYQPENILICGYSYGSAIGLWSIALLVEKHGVHYADLKIMCDRGFGNLFNYPPVKIFVKDNDAANKRLQQKEVMPAQHLHDLAMLLPASCVYEVEDEKRGYMNEVTLASTFAAGEMKGRCWQGMAETSVKSPHFAAHDKMQIKSIPELRPYYLMVAMLTEKSINLDIKHGNPDEKKQHNQASLHITTHVVSVLLKKIDDYCDSRSLQANHAETIKSYFKWTARQKIETAMQIRKQLDQANYPNVEALKYLHNQRGPQHSGTLNTIFLDVMALVTDLEQLLHFNKWISSMKLSRLVRQQALSSRKIFGLFATVDGDWEMVDSVVAIPDSIKNNQKFI